MEPSFSCSCVILVVWRAFSWLTNVGQSVTRVGTASFDLRVMRRTIESRLIVGGVYLIASVYQFVFCHWNWLGL